MARHGDILSHLQAITLYMDLFTLFLTRQKPWIPADVFLT